MQRPLGKKQQRLQVPRAWSAEPREGSTESDEYSGHTKPAASSSSSPSESVSWKKLRTPPAQSSLVLLSPSPRRRGGAASTLGSGAPPKKPTSNKPAARAEVGVMLYLTDGAWCATLARDSSRQIASSMAPRMVLPKDAGAVRRPPTSSSSSLQEKSMKVCLTGTSARPWRRKLGFRRGAARCLLLSSAGRTMVTRLGQALPVVGGAMAIETARSPVAARHEANGPAPNMA
mmetsp:Transcript_19785/g.56619  ORF Transcript_19785/g.56619 Transcript_19785/m.56619 type:complete len:231 (-) Transcript_19785:3-695(-)